ncbi:MAG: flagellin [Heyndrickxia faecalis]|jgi:flagellin|uniref:flagellin N-terminal helical domain-containing protein n=1 Tax=Heyndrickxia TaxID=2837504 RepID=UPI0021B279C1|nr:flagellin [Heyndrickxia coagulans]UXC23216.1 flagellin [Heyndrickxia coagulans]
MIINHNIAALNTLNHLNAATNAQSKAMQKLSSGLRINSAADDAAGLAISEKMRGQIRGLDQATRNAQDGISLLQTAEGALNETHDILQRMRELAVQGANDTNEDVDRDAIQEELDSLKTEVTRIGKSTQFNGKNLLDGTLGNKVALGTDLTVANGINAVKTNGTAPATYTLTVAQNSGDNSKTDITITSGGKSQTISAIANPAAGQSSNVTFDAFGITLEVNSGLNAGVAKTNNQTITVAASGVDFQIGANNEAEQKLNVTIDNMQADALGISGSDTHPTWSIADVDVSNADNARESIDVIEKAINQVSTQRSKLGAFENRLDHTVNNLTTSSENLTSAESRIRDVDMAKEMSEQTKQSILAQAAQAMLAQANQQPQQVLQLLR